MQRHRRVLSVQSQAILWIVTLIVSLPLLAQGGPTSNLSPSINFSVDRVSGNSPFLVRFTDLSAIPGAEAWEWDFGDGTTSTAQHPEHVYVEGGVFEVRLRVIGEDGQRAAVATALVRVDDEVIVDDFESPDWDQRWDVMGPVSRDASAAIEGDWGLRFGSLTKDGCTDCGTDPIIICVPVGGNEPSGTFAFWTDYSDLQLEEGSEFTTFRLFAEPEGGREVVSLEHRLRKGKLWVRARAGQSEDENWTSPWLSLGRFGAELAPQRMRVRWQRTPSLGTKAGDGSATVFFEVWDSATETWPVSASADGYECELDGYEYIVVGIDARESSKPVGGSLVVDGFEALRFSGTPESRD